MNWTDDRVEELERLQELLREVSMIDKSTQVLSRLKRCIKLAEKLRGDTFKAGFLDFLRYQAVEDRERNKEKS